MKSLVTVSRVKMKVREVGDMNTSETFIMALHNKVQSLIVDSIKQAQAAKRKTVMDRDLP